jgi:DNA mismatch endonuclease (patch repair protein)
MADFMTRDQRSRAMSKVRGRDTEIERIIRSSLHRKGFRFRKNVSSLPGRPDIVLAKYRSVIFIHGCLWHGHKDCKASKLPETRRSFWEKKITDNIIRDQRHIEALKDAGWNVLVVWECFIKNRNKREEVVEQIIKALKG